jgi:cytochrome c oxidase subunit I
MTVTESAPPTAPAAEPPADERVPVPGLVVVVGAGDHKVIGRLWIGTAVLHLLLAGVAGMVLSVERFDTSDISVISQDWFGQVFTFHAIAGAFLFLLPLTIGIATAVVPLQVGAPTIAFARGAAAAYWTYLVGGGLVIGGYAIDGGPFGADPDGVGIFIVGLIVVLVAQIVAWICIATTVVALRAPGVTMVRTPLFTWSALVAAAVWLLTLPVLAAVLVIAELDQRYGDVFLGGSNGLYDRIAWTFGQPALYAFAIPVLGIVGSVVPVLSATRHRLHKLAMGCIGAYGALSLGAWAQPAFTFDGLPVQPWLYEAPWIVVSFAIILPVLALLGLWVDTARGGRVTLASPLVYGAAAVLMLLVGLLAGAVQAIEPLEVIDGDAPLYGTTWTTGVAHYVLLASTIALLGAITWWAPKLAGRSLSEGLQKLIALGLLAGTVLLSLPDVISGLLGQGARLSGSLTGSNTDAVEVLNVVAAIGGALLVVAIVAQVIAVLAALGRSDAPGDDPWQGHTLEWATTSPPASGNFGALPEVSSEAPLYDARHPESVS